MKVWARCLKVAVLVLFAGVNAQAETDWSTVLTQARQLRSEGRTEEAETFLLKSWKEAESSGADRKSVAALCHSLGLIYLNSARWDESEKFFIRALHNWESAPVANSKDIVITADGLVTVYLAQLRIARAEAVFRSSAGAAAEELNPDDPVRTRWRCNWAIVLYHRGDLEGSEQILRESLTLWEKTFGPESPDLVVALNNLGSTYLKMNRLDDAIRCHERIRSISEKTGMRLVHAPLNLAQMYLKIHRDAEAEVLYRQALHNAEKAHSHDHLLVAEVLEQYALALRRWKRKGEAAKLHRQAKEIIARHALTTPAQQSVDVRELALR